MSELQRLRQLARITETALSAVQADMMKVRSEETALRNQLREIRDRAQQKPEAGSPAYKAGADVRWQRWVDRRREEINFELARVLARKDATKSRLRIAFGKDRAIQMLVLKRQMHDLRKKSQSGMS